MVSLRRRQVIIAGLGTVVAPAAISKTLPEAPDKREKLVLSGRILGADGKPLAGATVAAGRARSATDADGRFMLVTDTRRYRVTYRGRSAEGLVSNQRPDTDGTWRASFGLTLA
jgi:protocatechuate 3,4-dioxygenase beta subunit